MPAVTVSQELAGVERAEAQLRAVRVCHRSVVYRGGPRTRLWCVRVCAGGVPRARPGLILAKSKGPLYALKQRREGLCWRKNRWGGLTGLAVAIGLLGVQSPLGTVAASLFSLSWLRVVFWCWGADGVAFPCLLSVPARRNPVSVIDWIVGDGCRAGPAR